MLLVLDHLAQLQEAIPVGVKHSVQQIQLIPPHLPTTHQLIIRHKMQYMQCVSLDVGSKDFAKELALDHYNIPAAHSCSL